MLLIAGCGSSLKNSWDNFTAYYNTFYNAKNDFEAGLRQIENQPVQINPDIPVRPHPAPVNAGREYFEDAISRSALILRRHPNSKWTDDALFLIGKSYYYRQEYFLAIQKFEELLSSPAPDMLKQQAVLWKGRALLDISSYGEGLSFIETQLANTDLQWTLGNKSEARIILAQHLAMLERWQQSAEVLEPAVLGIESRPLKGRSYFLLGQVLEKQDDFTRAYQAYSNVSPNFPDYKYIYWADVKRAEVSRLNDNLSLAVSIYNSMLNDDKNFLQRDELFYQLAQTYEQQGNYREAEAIYKRILSKSVRQNGTSLLADTYYQLGQLYSNRYHDYELAAAYFDSSSSQSVQQTKAEDEEGALALASAYSDYVSLKNEIAATDSLLNLGALDAAAFDSALVTIRREREAALRQNRQLARPPENTLANVNPEAFTGTPAEAEPASSFGFLNYRNTRMAERGMQQFRAVWGARPLVDNWRRTNVIVSTGNEGTAGTIQNTGAVLSPQGNFSDEQLGINIADVPISRQAKMERIRERTTLQYRLGNLFFLTLNQPDSAKVYFKKVAGDTSASSLIPRALYSLSELYDLQQKPDSARLYKDRVFREYPASVFADRLRNEQKEKVPVVEKDSAALLRLEVQQILASGESNSAAVVRAEKLRDLALQNRNSPLSPYIFYRAVREYIRWAKSPFAVADTSGPVLPQVDSTHTVTADTLVREKYTGEKWDKVRALLDEFKQLFPGAPQVQQINSWAGIISGEDILSLFTCSELGVSPVISPDMQTFLKEVQLPERVRGLNLSGSVAYRLVINEQGVVESYELVSSPTNLGIEEAYEQAINQSLRFKPIRYEGTPVRVSCEVTFPISQ